jgi:hypothetical protein
MFIENGESQRELLFQNDSTAFIREQRVFFKFLKQRNGIFALSVNGEVFYKSE